MNGTFCDGILGGIGLLSFRNQRLFEGEGLSVHVCCPMSCRRFDINLEAYDEPRNLSWHIVCDIRFVVLFKADSEFPVNLLISYIELVIQPYSTQ